MANYQVILYHKNQGMLPVVAEGIVWETQRCGAPGKLTFDIINDRKWEQFHLDFQEGDLVKFYVEEELIFQGYVFSKERNSDQIISVTAYDQLRYLKMKSVFVYTDLTATDVVRSILQKYQLDYGVLEDSEYLLSRSEDGVTLFDMIQNAVDVTRNNTKELYVLYDDCGKIQFRNTKQLKLDYWLHAATANDFSYKSSIDDGVYNMIILYKDNEETGSREYFITTDKSNIAQWGLLPLFEKVEDEKNPIQETDMKMDLYNRKNRTLSVSGAKGDIRVRAGYSIMVNLALGDVDTNSFLLVESAKHSFKDGEHSMDLSLQGGALIEK